MTRRSDTAIIYIYIMTCIVPINYYYQIACYYCRNQPQQKRQIKYKRERGESQELEVIYIYIMIDTVPINYYC